MAKKKKKVVVSKVDSNSDTKRKIQTVKTAAAKPSSRRASGSTAANVVMPFNKQNYIWVIGGIALITLGMILMIGGYNTDPMVWDESKIYGFQRTTLAPLLIVAGLCVEIYAIFK